MLATPAERTAFEQGRAEGVAQTFALIDTVRTFAPDLLPPAGTRLTMADLAAALTRYDPAALAILRPFNFAEAITVKQAARLTGFAPRTIAQWAGHFRIGRLVVGSLRVSHPALLALLDDDALALAAMLAGHRDHPAVLPYFVRAGLRVPDGCE